MGDAISEALFVFSWVCFAIVWAIAASAWVLERFWPRDR